MEGSEHIDPVTYVTLVEAAAEVDASPEELRQAIQERQLWGVKENPDNQRSRWLVPLEEARSLFENRESGPQRPDITITQADEEPPRGDAIRIGIQNSRMPKVKFVDKPFEAEVYESDEDTQVSADEHRSDEGISAEVRPPAQSQPHGSQDHEFAERLSAVIDRLEAAVPEPPLDYQSLLDKYAAAVQEAAALEARQAAMLSQQADLERRLTEAIDRAERGEARMRLLVAELQEENAHIAASHAGEEGKPVDPPGGGIKPLLKRRKRA